MVVMEDGLPRPSEYKRFKVRNVPGNDDYAAMEEVLTRRLTAYLEEKELPVADRKRHFSYPPQLLLVDGGKGQLNVAVRVLEELGLEDEIPVAALAKQFEEVYLPGQADPVRVPRGSEALYLLQQGTGRGAPIRHLLPPPAAGQADDRLGAGRGAGPRAGPAQAPVAELGSIKAVGKLPKRRWRPPGCPSRWPRPCGRRSTARRQRVPMPAWPGGGRSGRRESGERAAENWSKWARTTRGRSS